MTGTSVVEEDEPDTRPVTTSLTVVPEPPLKLLPDTSSYAVMPPMATPNTTAAATTSRRRLLTRAR
ncbi:hypothetical protein [Streptomyces sp. RB17]|uniref:hypothetical protein n=1 Tax=Streptomyces sp. RB17 TaxID=2585197 RepID=UPI001295CA18|nr:hypothetical protein [Streptomyces sp. RB17]